MLLYLVRHAIAEERDPARWPDDSTRPLSERGARRFIQAVRGLRALGLVPQVALSSPYLRTAETATLLADRAGWPPSIEAVALATGNRVSQVELLRGYSQVASLGVVGHEPHLSRLASWLLAGDDAAIAFDWRRGGLAVLALPALEASAARLEAFLPPRVLRDAHHRNS